MEVVAMRDKNKVKIDSEENGIIVNSKQQAFEMLHKREFELVVSTTVWEKCKTVNTNGVK
jgi:hypothetical protein